MTDQARKELAEAYQLMMQSAAWKHFDEKILSPIAAVATKDEDAIPTMELAAAAGRIGECRGKRWTVNYIKSSISFIVDGLK